jgi:hypothetical protein
MFQITSVMVLLDVAVIFFRSIVVLTPNGNVWTVPLLQSVSDIIGFLNNVHNLGLETETVCWMLDLFYFLVEGSRGTYVHGPIHNS